MEDSRTVPLEEALAFLVQALVRSGAVDPARFRDNLKQTVKECIFTYGGNDEYIEALQEFALIVGNNGTMKDDFELLPSDPPGAWLKEAKEYWAKKRAENGEPEYEEEEETQTPQKEKPTAKVKPRK
jgi:hypothetical protein